MEDESDEKRGEGPEEEEEEAVVTMSQDFGGDITDIPEAGEEEDEGREHINLWLSK